ncbi:MAG: glycosyltransferase [Chloroflexi bacterium]|nr:glycosyltransferase [Chloroflexota bacterium]
MKVLLVYKDYFPVLGGIENHLRLLATGLATHKEMKVEVLVTDPGRRTQRLSMDGVSITKAGRWLTAASAPISTSLFLEMRRRQADIYHLHFPYPIGEMAYLLAGAKGKLVITYHSDIIRQRRLLLLYRPFLWRLLGRADRIIVQSPNYVASSPYLRRVAKKCTVIPSAVDMRRFEATEGAAVAAWRRRFPPPLVLFVGRFRYYKGLQYLIQAMKKIKATLLLSGSGPLESQLRHQVAALALEDRIFFLGEVPDGELPSLYQAADIFVLPACERSEAFGLTQVEAMASGVPVICTELGTGTSYVNIHGETGLVVPPRDPEALAQAINTLLDNPGLRQQLGGGGRERAAREFGVETMVQRTIQLYQELVS